VHSSARRALGATRLLPVSLAAALSASFPAPLPALDLPPLRSEGAPYFTADLAIALDRGQQPGVSVSLTLPYTALEWLRFMSSGTERFGAGVEFSIIFEGKGDIGQKGDVWERRFVVATLGETRAAGAVVSDKRTFALPPGRYQVRIMATDLNSKARSRVEQRMDVPDYTKMPVGFSDLELGVVDSTGGFRPIPTRQFGLESGRIGARASLFDRRPGDWPRSYSFVYRIRGEVGDVIVSGNQDVTMAASGDSVVLRPAMTDLFLGSYVFEVELAEGKSHWRVERTFEVEESGPPRGREFVRMLEPLAYIVTAQEIDWLRSLPPEQQAQGWEEVWRRRDPTPETPKNEMQLEFFRRVRYAERHFQGFGPGWRSDMGRIYIKFGPPDQIETRPASLTSPQLEIWYYNQPYRRLVFGDREGFGRYTLLNPSVE
jgi:GWxTD domain-containing protein